MEREFRRLCHCTRSACWRGVGPFLYRSFVVQLWNFRVSRPSVLVGVWPYVDHAVGEVPLLSARSLGEVKFDIGDDRRKQSLGVCRACRLESRSKASESPNHSIHF